MKRFAWTLTALLLCVTTRGFAYDGPTPLITYDQTINSIHVVFTSQPAVLAGGRSHFTATIQTPVDIAGQQITLEIWKYVANPPPGEGDVLVDNSCVHVATPAEAGTTITFTCDVYQLISGLPATGTIELYPRVVRSGAVLDHNGRDVRLTVPVRGDDGFEPNNSFFTATSITPTVGTPLVFTDLIQGANLDNDDYYRFVAPASGSADIKIEFWNAANDLDLFVFDQNGNQIGGSQTSDDVEETVVPITAGQTYFIDVSAASTIPLYYDLTVTLGGPHTITVTPTATPMTVASGGTISLAANAVDSLGHMLTYQWGHVTANCPAAARGTFSDLQSPTPTWAAPINSTTGPLTCRLRVTVNDGFVSAVQGDVVVTIADQHQITITSGPSGTPNPVASGGNVALNVAAGNAANDPISYAWSANCPTLGNNGSFSPNANVQNPTWTAATNIVGTQQACTISVTASNGLGQTANGSFNQLVDSVGDVVTITAGPSAAPDPVNSGGTAALTVSAADSLGHAISYAWSATCTGGLSSGTFMPNASAQNPNWVAPVNTTGAQQTCALSATASDAFAHSATGAWTEHVNSVPDTVTITNGPTGAPEPVASNGAVGLTLAASDSLGHALTYAWTASCTGGIGVGSFAPNAAAQTPTWTAPVNATGAQQTCTLGVTVSDAFAHAANGSWPERVNSVADTVTITSGPTGTPEPVTSGGAVTLALTAVDSIAGHALTYAWTAACTGGIGTGSFTPGANVAAPTWNAPANATGAQQTCTISVTASDAFTHSANGSWSEHVNSIGDTVTITNGPTGTPEPVASGGAVTLAVTATDSIAGHALTYAWSASCTGGLGVGGFTPNASAQNPTWNAPANATGTQETCTLSVTASDGFGHSATSPWTEHVNSIADTVTITSGPTGSPEPVASSGVVTLSLSAIDSIAGHALSYSWSAACTGGLGNGSFVPNAAVATPTWTAPANATGAQQTCTLSITVSDGFGHSAAGSWSEHVNSIPDTVSITSGPTGTPDPVGSAGNVTLNVVATDSISHPLTYAWSASCTGGIGNGTFSPGGSTPSPTWTAPSNATGTQQPCTISVTVNDTFGHSATGSWIEHVNSIAATVTITSGPTGTPEPVASAGTVTLSLTATSSVGATLTYAWTSSCTGGLGAGTFVPNAATAAPAWNAPSNATGAQQTCTLAVTVSDGSGHSASGSWPAHVNSIGDTVTITSGPTGSPDPIASGGAVSLALTATDSVGHALTYAWVAVCSNGLGTGSFVPNATSATPTWNAPVNTTGNQQTCTLGVTISDAFGHSVIGSWDEHVNSVGDTVTITSGPTGSPEPVASAGVVTLALTAADSVGHTLTYQWTATCTGGIGAGTFTPSATAATPTWTAPSNASGSQQTCTLAVTASDGGFGHTANGSWPEHVNSIGDTVTITSGPTGSPDPVSSGGAVTLALSATDSVGHALTYAWSASCSGGLATGTFAPAANVATPTWTAPANSTGAQQICTLSVTASDAFTHSATGSWAEHVNSVGDTVTITSGPTGTPEPVASAGTVTLALTAVDSIAGHALTYAWSASCTGGLGNGSFTPSATTAAPTWNVPANATGAQQSCTLSVTVSDAFTHSATGTWTEHVNSIVDTVTITSGPTGTPDPVASSGTVTLALTASDSIAGHALTYAWSQVCAGGIGIGSFTPNASAPTPTWTAPSNATGTQQTCTLSITVSDAFGHSATGSWTEHVNSIAAQVTITSGPTGTPDPVASGGLVTLSLTASSSVPVTLTYAWTASCTGSLASGSFAPGPNVATPVWTAPPNTTGAQQTCTLAVTVSDGAGHSASGSWPERVNSIADTVTITSAPTGTPEPVGSGSAVALAVAAVDSVGHAVTYAWSATCSGGLGSGSFAPSAAVAAPTWTAPANATGAQQTCTLAVTASDAFAHSANGTWTEHVNSVGDTVTITSGPTGTPEPVASAGAVTLALVANDSIGHALTYAWTASCTGGIGNGNFVPGSTVATPTWSAPANNTNAQQTCTLSVSVSDAFGHVANGTWAEHVNPVALTITSGPGGTPNPVSPGGLVALSVTANPPAGLTYGWSAACTGGIGNGSFSPSASVASPSWHAPANPTSSTETCVMSVSVSNGAQPPIVVSFNEIVGSGQQCNYTLTPTATSQGVGGGPGSVGVSSLPACFWTATTDASWIDITLGPTGTGNGLVQFLVARNDTHARRTATLFIAGQSIPVSQDAGSFDYYFAEGATINHFFKTRFTLLNPDPTTAASVSVEFQTTGGVLTHSLSVPAHTQVTLDASTLAATVPALAALDSAEFSTVFHSDIAIVADRTMTWDNNGYGSHAETSVQAPGSVWYLAEGATINGFDLYYLIQNPNTDSLNDEITVTYLLPGGQAPIVRTYSMPGKSRMNIYVNAEPGLANKEVSAIITTPAGKPVIVERAMYLSGGGLFWAAGHESAGIQTPATAWFFAEGSTGDFFDEFLLVGNPNSGTAHITTTYLFDDGTVCTKNDQVPGLSRFNIWVDAEVIPGCGRSLANAAVSATITSDIPVVAERTMWWPGPTAATWTEAHNAAGATSAGTKWAVADGEQGGSASNETYLLIANTSSYAGTARVTLYLADGTTTFHDVALPANSRTNVAVGAPVENGGFGAAVANKRFGAVIESLPVSGQTNPAQIVVERAMYSNGPGATLWAAGTDVLATKIQ